MTTTITIENGPSFTVYDETDCTENTQPDGSAGYHDWAVDQDEGIITCDHCGIEDVQAGKEYRDEMAGDEELRRHVRSIPLE